MIIVGIDPGKGGAVVTLDHDGSVSSIMDTPLVRVGRRHEYSLAAMSEILRYYPPDTTLLAIEQVGVRPGEGVLGAFTFGTGFGLWLGIAAAYKLPIERITPQRWQKVMLEGLPKGKGSAIARAQELFPDAAMKLKRIKDHGRADALLIAEYARRTFRAAAAA